MTRYPCGNNLSLGQIQNLTANDGEGVQDGLLGLWSFNSGVGDIVYDRSGNQNHGQVNGATWFVLQFLENNSLTFNGSSDYVKIPTSQSLDAISMASLSAWIKPDRYSDGAHIEC